MDATLLQLLLGGGGFIGAMFGLIKYMTSENRKSQDTFLKYIETKNGHIERIANKFVESSDRNNTTLEKNTEQITILNERILPYKKVRMRK